MTAAVSVREKEREREGEREREKDGERDGEGVGGMGTWEVGGRGLGGGGRH